MFLIFLTALITNNADFELIKSKSKSNDELTVDQKIEILAWRTEIMAQAMLELDDKINYLINNVQYKNITNVNNCTQSR